MNKLLILTLSSLIISSACTYPVRPDDRPQINQLLSSSASVIKDESFVAIISAISADEFNHSADDSEHRSDDGAKVLVRLADNPITGVVCRRAKNPFNRSTNAWEGEGTPELRCCFLKERSDELWVGTIVHEQAHAAGYLHNGEKRSGNECTVPHLVGDLATYVLQEEQGHPSLPKDACPALRKSICKHHKTSKLCGTRDKP